MISLNIANLHRKFKLNEALVGALARRITGRLGLKKERLSIVFIDNKAIKKLNRRFKGRDSATDVLSFRTEGGVPGKEISECDIFISLDKAKANSRLFKEAFEKEIVLYMIHGMLHMAGFDDGLSRDEKKMRSKERELLNYLCKTTDLSKVLTRR